MARRFDASPGVPPRRSSAGPWLFILGASILGVGVAAVVMQGAGSTPTPTPEPDAPKPTPGPSPQPAPRGDTGNPEPAAEPAATPALESVAFTKASLALANQADPYNPELEALTVYLNQHQKIDPNSAAGALYNGIRSFIGAIPIVGSIVNIGMTLFEFIGPLVVGPSSGGGRDISILARQRAVIYQLTPSFYDKPKPYKSQQIDMRAPLDKPARSVGFGVQMPQEEYDRQYRAWLRRLLQTRRYEAEFFRVTRTLDEVMLPAVVMEFLYREGAWPPPLEPMPPSAAEFRARYQYSENPLKNYYFDDGAIEHDNPVTREVWEQLAAEYAEDAQMFSARIARVQMPPDLEWLAVNAGSVPRWGSPAAPRKVARRGVY